MPENNNKYLDLVSSNTVRSFCINEQDSDLFRKKLNEYRLELRGSFNTHEYERKDIRWYHNSYLEYFLFPYESSLYNSRKKVSA